MGNITEAKLVERVELLERIVLQQGEIIEALALNCKLLDERIDSLDEPKIPDHENIRGAEYYK